MIPADVMAQLATLGLSQEQARSVAGMLATVEAATKAESDAAVARFRAVDAARSRRYRDRGGGDIPPDLRSLIMERDSGQCQECGSFDYPQIDHVHPVSKGGKTEEGNLQVLCRVCNARKKDRIRKAIPRNSTDEAGMAGIPRKKEIPPTPPKEKTKTKPSGLGVSVARASDLADFRAELLDLDADRLDAIEKHRRSKRGQLTGHSARLFRRDAEACGLSLADAVDTCISRNWITVKPEYLAGRQHRANAPPPQRTISDALGEMAAGTWQPPDTSLNEPFIETSFTRGN